MTAPLALETGSSPCLVLNGDWTLENYEILVAAARPLELSIASLDASNMTAMDTAGATVLVNLLGATDLARLASSATGLSEERKALLIAVGNAVANQKPCQGQPARRFGDGLASLGAAVHDGWRGIQQLLGFLGLALATMLKLLFQPARWRVTALVAQMHQTGLNAVPIVMLLNFLVGAVVAFLGATVLQEFGATIYTVDLVAYAFMRELGVLLAAILLAGRTASAFTAQIGSMKINEELDALKVQRLDPMELLVLPRMLALLLVLPLLTWLAIMAGMAGGAVVAVVTLDIPVAMFVSIVQEIPYGICCWAWAKRLFLPWSSP